MVKPKTRSGFNSSRCLNKSMSHTELRLFTLSYHPFGHRFVSCTLNSKVSENRQKEYRQATTSESSFKSFTCFVRIWFLPSRRRRKLPQSCRPSTRLAHSQPRRVTSDMVTHPCWQVKTSPSVALFARITNSNQCILGGGDPLLHGWEPRRADHWAVTYQWPNTNHDLPPFNLLLPWTLLLLCFFFHFWN